MRNPPQRLKSIFQTLCVRSEPNASELHNLFRELFIKYRLTLQPSKDQGLPTDCWLHVHLSAELNDRSFSLGVICAQHVESPIVYVSVIGSNYRYKSVTGIILHDADLAPIPFTGRKFFPHPIVRAML